MTCDSLGETEIVTADGIVLPATITRTPPIQVSAERAGRQEKLMLPGL